MNGVSRFLSRREKRDKHLHIPSKDAYRVFSEDKERKGSQKEEKSIQEILKRLEQLDIGNIKEYNVKYALHHPYAQGDLEKALELLRLLHETLCGKLIKFNPVIPMVGAENRNMVTCYIDSLLFSMFARVDSFESMLSVKFPNPATNNLANLIRLWVNMLRTGKLITIDLVKHIQDALAECGWQEAGLIRQQDVSEAFTFITDKLALPLLTLKMDVYHTGKESSDDHRLVRERLLDVAIPEEPLPDGAVIRLEDCLENFLNNKVEVRRMLQRRNTINTRPIDPIEKEASTAVTEIDRNSPQSPLFRKFTMTMPSKPPSSTLAHKDDIDISYGPKSTGTETVLRKEVLLPAWQFFHLIPWFQNKATTDGQPTTDSQVAAHFAKRRPILGICLKRYKQTAEGPKRLDTFIDIPLEMRLPHFISDGTQDDGFGSSFSTFKLSLQSIVCHRGLSLNAGHYISIVRPTSNEFSSSTEVDPKYQWFRHDDLAKEHRVSVVDVRKALKEECAYLLFYQVQLIDEDEEYNYATRSSSELEEPPTYAEATHSTPVSPPLSAVPEGVVKLTNNEVHESAVPAIASADFAPTQVATHGVDQKSGETNLTSIDLPHLRPASSMEEQGSSRRLSATIVEDTKSLRPSSFDISSTRRTFGTTGSSRLSRKSHESVDGRSSINLTDKSNLASPLTTPHDEKSHGDGGLVVEAVVGGSLKGSTSPGKLFSFRRDKPRDTNKLDDHEIEKEAEKNDRRLSRTWLATVNKHNRPKSVPPSENRTSMADLMKTFKLGSSKDKLPVTTVVGPDGDVMSPETSGDGSTKPSSAHQSPKLSSAGFESTPKTKKDGKEKLAGLGIGRRRSLRVKNGSRRVSVVGIAAEDSKDDPDRQCLLM